MIGRLLAATAALVGLGACAGSDGYEFIRSAGETRAQCERELTVAAQRDCERLYEMDHEEYLEQRREAMSQGTRAEAETD